MEVDIEYIRKKFGANLERLRGEKDLSQDVLGIKCGFKDGSQISKWERGVSDIKLSRIIGLSKVLEIDPKELLDF